MDSKSVVARARRGSVSLKGMSSISSKLKFHASSAKRAVKERYTKAQFSFADDSKKWVWVVDPEKAFVPASVVEERKVTLRV